MTDNNDLPPAESADDMWAAAMAESAELTASTPTNQEPAPAASTEVFKPLANVLEGDVTPRVLEMIKDIPVTLTVELGRTRLTIKELLEMAQGHVINLEGLAGEPMNIFINNHLVGSGEVVVHEHKYGIRITEIVTPTQRIQKLNKK